MGRRDYFSDDNKLKKLSIVFAVTLVLTIVTFVLIFNLYNQKLRENAEQSLLELGSINAVVPNVNNEALNPASSTNDKSINEVKKESTKKSSSSKKDNVNQISSEKIKDENTVNQNIVDGNIVSENLVQQENKELNFIAPVNGEISKDFASDTLIYSKTLEEWTTHSGIDIKAPKTTIVVASETGVIESIKSDPRYGLTVTITHSNGFKTVYSNLLTAEFVKEGETVEKGQTLGTVGESSSFEIAEEAHLHFEMTKDGQNVNPTLYLK